jgi:hypothetical protein
LLLCSLAHTLCVLFSLADSLAVEPALRLE